MVAAAPCFLATLPPAIPSSNPFPSSSHKLSKPKLSSSSLPPFSLLQIPTTWKWKWDPPQIQPTTSTTAAFLGIESKMGLLFLVSTSSVLSSGAASAAEIPLLALQEPENALSLPTWAIHVSSVVEWITAMVLVWEYGDKSGYESWKGLSWGMVPLLGGAFCACTWHFFYNSESLEVLVVLQAALTVIGNFTMCIAAFRIYKSLQGGSENP